MTGSSTRQLSFPTFVLAAAALLTVPLAAQIKTTAPAPLPLFGKLGVSPLAVRQGVLGSCYFHASLAAVAKAAPETLRAAISTNPDGSYRVRFYDGPEETVFPEDVEFGRQHSYDRSEGGWVTVVMRAYAQRALRLSLVSEIKGSALIPAFVKPMALSFLDQSSLLLVAYDRAIRSVVSQDGDMDKAALKLKLAAQLSALGIPSTEAEMLGSFLEVQGFYDALALTVRQNGEVFGAYKSLGQGGIPVRVIETFLGKASAGLVKDNGPLMAQLRRMHAGGTALVASTGPTAPPPDPLVKTPGWFVGQHSYSLLDYDEMAQTVTARNPWGARPDPDGVVMLPLGTFLQSFESYSYSEPPAPKPTGQ